MDRTITLAAHVAAGADPARLAEVSEGGTPEPFLLDTPA